MRRMVTRRWHRLGRSKRKLPCRENDRAERQAHAWHVQVITRSQRNSEGRKEKVDVGWRSHSPAGTLSFVQSGK